MKIKNTLIKNKNEINIMRKACKLAAEILDIMCNNVHPNMTTYDLDQFGKYLMDERKVTSACFNYKYGNLYYPCYTCLSVNEEVVHGVASKRKIIKEGDVLKIDVSIKYNHFIGDNARTIIIGSNNSYKIQNLLKKTEKALYLGIEQAVYNNKTGNISYTIQNYIENNNLSIVREFSGHGIGRYIHEEPFIPNFGNINDGIFLYPGMTLAIEPIVNLGQRHIKMSNDGWTAITKDELPSAHFEHTILITQNKPEILTIL